MGKGMNASEKIEEIIDKYIDPENGFDHDSIMLEVKYLEKHNRLLLDVARASVRMRAALSLYFKHINSPVAIGWDELVEAVAEYDKALARAREAGIKLEEVRQCHTTSAKNAET